MFRCKNVSSIYFDVHLLEKTMVFEYTINSNQNMDGKSTFLELNF